MLSHNYCMIDSLYDYDGSTFEAILLFFCFIFVVVVVRTVCNLYNKTAPDNRL